MKKLLFVVLLIFTSQLNATTIALNKLMEVNENWAYQADAAKCLNNVQLENNITYTDWIATHLKLVVTTLKQRDVSRLSSPQKNNRMALLTALDTYWQAKIFPINDYLNYKSPVFIDRLGTHCAVGYLMQQSGSEQLAQAINKAQKFAYISEIKNKEVPIWASANGFTIDELAWIQPGYQVTNTAVDLSGGLNGAVNAILVSQAGSSIYAGGLFSSSISGVSCNNIAVYQSGFAGWSWIALNAGVNGSVYAMIEHNNQLIVGGSFTQADGLTTNHIAAYDLGTGQWQAMGTLDSTVKTLAIYNNEIYAGGSFTELLAKWNGTTWQDVNQGYLYGEEVRTLYVYDSTLVIGGSFELPTGALRKNACSYDGAQIINMGFGTATPVNDFEFYNGRLYAACDAIDGNDSCALALYENFDWQKVIVPGSIGFNSFFGTNIKSIATDGAYLICGGNFNCSSGMDVGSSLMRFEQASTAAVIDYNFTPMLTLDSSVNAIDIESNFVYFGGNFINNLGISNVLNHIGYMDVLTTTKKINTSNNESFQLFPNPANNQAVITFSTLKNIKKVTITNVIGEIVLQINMGTNNQNYLVIDTNNLPNGMYMISVSEANQIVTKKLLVAH
jgi:hypothetical protein